LGRVVVVGSYNAGLTIVGDRLPELGQTVLGHTFDMGPGGKGSNQAIGARRLDAEVTLVANVGHDVFGDAAIHTFEREGLLGAGIRVVDEHTGVAFILVDESGNNMISVAPGANGSLQSADLDSVPGLFDRVSHLLCQPECPVELFVGAAQRARAAGVTTILNPAPARPLPPAALPLIDILTPNETELRALARVEGSDDDSIDEAGRNLIALGIDHVIVTLGHRGVRWVSSRGVEFFPARRVVARDTTGAGDAFNAGLVTALAAGASVPEAIDLGMRAGAFCATRLGVIDGLPTRVQLDEEIP